ncbi:methyl-accepting chemotaxis protein [Paenibacillus sinopodophylli]|uniref:methyl-accepting chemotaxis protein n=1 Tax=Paenibacillus sinopodophylli TaxID=1837342 RepID=UPI00110CF4A7|nr:methyl-accepting chemotaxis protein [Paenibacillus sinopodophylli]
MLHAMLRPFAAIMSRLRYGQKFIFVSVLMIIPIVLLLSIWLSDQQRDLTFIKNEQAGASQIKEVLPFMLLVQQHRGLANGFLNGNIQSQSDLNKNEQEISDRIVGMESLLEVNQFPESSRKWDEVQSEWNRLSKAFGQLKPSESFEAHSALIDQIKSLMISYSDESGLSLDTAMDSFYLMTVLVQQLPVLIENTAVIRGQGNGVLASKTLSEETKIKLLVEMSKMDSAFHGLNKSLGAVANWSSKTNTDLVQRGEQSIEATDLFRALVASEILNAPILKAKSEDFFAEGTKTISVLNELFSSASAELDVVLESRSGKMISTRNGLLTVTIFSLLLAAMFYAGFYRNVMQAVSALKIRVEEMAKGDLSRELQLHTRDELQQVGLAFNDMLRALNVLLRRNQAVSEKAAASSVQLKDISYESTSAMKLVADAIQSVSSGTELQSMSTSETATAMHEMAVGITRIAEAASEAAEATVNAAGHVRLGDEQLEETARQMNSIKGSQVESAKVVAKLDAQSVQIEQIVTVIMGIAKQTKMLALNANIEAARAGEHGRGFSIVALEVGKLAEQSALSAESITELLSDVRANVDETVIAMDEMRKETDSGLQAIGQTQATISSILSNIQMVSEQVQEVSAASEQISAGMEEVTASIGEVATVSRKTSTEAETMAAATEQQLASMEEIQASAEMLRRISKELQDDLNQFVLASE